MPLIYCIIHIEAGIAQKKVTTAAFGDFTMVYKEFQGKMQQHNGVRISGYTGLSHFNRPGMYLDFW